MMFITPIDTPAAAAHAVLLAAGIRALGPEQRTAWSRLLVAFGVRTPETLRDLGPDQYRRAVAQTQANPTPEREVEAEAVVAAKISAEMRALERNVPLQIAMELADDPTKFRVVAGMHWWLRRFGRGELLLGDRPLLSQPTANWPCGVAIDDPNCLVTLPISPDVVFFASANRGIQAAIRREGLARLLRNINQRTIECAVEYVYAANTSMAEVVCKSMHGRTPAWPRSGTQPDDPS